jgi:hypothetical protein
MIKRSALTNFSPIYTKMEIFGRNFVILNTFLKKVKERLKTLLLNSSLKFQESAFFQKNNICAPNEILTAIIGILHGV